MLATVVFLFVRDRDGRVNSLKGLSDYPRKSNPFSEGLSNFLYQVLKVWVI